MAQLPATARFPYVVAVALAIAGAAVRLMLLSSLGSSFTFVTFYPAVMLASLYGGFGPGLLATIVAVLLVDWFWTEPIGQFLVNTPAEWLGMALFAGSCALIALVTEAMHRARSRARSAEMQRRTDEQYRLLFDNNPSPMWVFDEETLDFLAVNEAAIALYGWSRDEFLAMTIADIRPAADVPRLKQKVAEQSGAKVFAAGIWQHCRKDGSLIDVEITVSALPFAGRPGRLALMNDVTARRRADAALQQERDLLQAIMNGAQNSHLVYLDRDFNFVRVNETYANSCGYHPEEMTGLNHFRLYPNAENEAIFTRVRDRGEPVTFHDKPFEFPDQPDRGITYWDWTLTPVRGQDGRIAGMVFALFETTARKRAEEALARAKAEAEQRAAELAAVLEAVPAAVWIATDPECQHIEGNRTANELLRLPEGGEASLTSPASVRPTHFKAIKDGREMRDDELPVQMAARGIELHDIEHTLLFDDGTIRHLLGNATPLFDEQGQPRGSVAAFVDITLRKQAENDLQKLNIFLEQRVASRTEELRQKDLLLLKQSRLAAMGEMINNIAHQWRQPLNLLGLNIQRLLLFYDLKDFNREFLEKSTDDAMNLIRHMSQTIDDFRNFFRPDKEKTGFSLEQAVQQTLSLVNDGLMSSKIKVVTRIEGDPQLNGYFNEFCQVLLNIVQNARDVIVERSIAGGTITIAATTENDRTVITIGDNAGGIPDEIIGRIFEPYFSTKGVQGTGIGLFMSKNIIEKSMGGTIQAVNTRQGAEFRIEV